jgi:hypothetical protein
MININDELAQFTGTENYYKHWLGNKFVYTDGIKAMAEKFNAYWLVDIPFTWQSKEKVYREKFQVWRLESQEGRAVITMRSDDDKPVIVCQRIPLTDFPDGKFKMYYIDDEQNKVLLLPSEY